MYSLPFKWNNAGDITFYQNRVTFKIMLNVTLLGKYAEANGIGGTQVY
jgi:hypothetical protein